MINKQKVICEYDNNNQNQFRYSLISKNQYEFNKYIIHNMWMNISKYDLKYIKQFLKDNTVF